MFGNYYGGPGMISNMGFGPMTGTGSMMGMGPMMGTTMGRGLGNLGRGMAAQGAIGGAQGIGSLGRLGAGARAGSGILSGLRGVNWSGLLNNASKTLGVVKEAIPIVKEAGPMMHNMKSMLKIASVFKDETDVGSTKNTSSREFTSEGISGQKENISINTNTDSSRINSDSISNEPNFFL